jgi:sulfatase maturation enzyme AslB (radical SAM superfamily)
MRDSPLCLYPWFHQLVNPDGTAIPCCSWNQSKEHMPNIHHSEFFNSQFMHDLRAQMLTDQVPGGCKMCIAGEQAGGFSNRLFSFRRVENYDFDYTDGPKLIGQELNLSNLCNLRCRMCDSSRSSKWIAEDLAFDRPTAKLQKSGWTLSDSEAQSTRFLTFLGGEPLLHQDQIATSLEKIAEHNRLSTLTVNFNTNLTNRIQSDLLTLLGKCDRVEINVSIDGVGKLNDYIRSDSVWEELVQNMHWLDQECGRTDGFGWIPTNTVTVLNCNKMEEFYRWYDDTNFSAASPPTAPILAWEPWMFAVNNLPNTVKQTLTARYQHFATNAKWSAHMQSLSEYLTLPTTGPEDLNCNEEFWKFTNFLDQRRGTSFDDVNPEMANWLKI